jgi:hypothetical protein
MSLELSKSISSSTEGSSWKSRPKSCPSPELPSESSVSCVELSEMLLCRFLFRIGLLLDSFWLKDLLRAFTIFFLGSVFVQINSCWVSLVPLSVEGQYNFSTFCNKKAEAIFYLWNLHFLCLVSQLFLNSFCQIWVCQLNVFCGIVQRQGQSTRRQLWIRTTYREVGAQTPQTCH